MAELQILTPHEKDLGGGFTVKRLLPAAARQGVGPFVFFDHFGPVTAGPDAHHDVRPHPHIGLATVTYLFEGAMLHRDSTGAVQRIEPGAVNIMTAGRGIVHSERTPPDLVGQTRRSHGLQLWLALPAEREEDPPRFQHVGAAELPQGEVAGFAVRVLVGSAFGLTSPVASPTLFLDLQAPAAEPAALTVPDAALERAVYSPNAAFELDGRAVAACTLVVLPPGACPVLRAPPAARLVVIGGTGLGPRHIVWNFVSSRMERIEAARQDWAAQRFDRVPGETEFIPLPPRADGR